MLSEFIPGHIIQIGSLYCLVIFVSCFSYIFDTQLAQAKLEPLVETPEVLAGYSRPGASSSSFLFPSYYSTSSKTSLSSLDSYASIFSMMSKPVLAGYGGWSC